MKYEQMPIKPLIKRKAAAKLTTDMSKLNTFNILRYLYKRHNTGIWMAGACLELALIVWIRLGR